MPTTTTPTTTTTSEGVLEVRPTTMALAVVTGIGGHQTFTTTTRPSPQPNRCQLGVDPVETLMQTLPQQLHQGAQGQGRFRTTMLLLDPMLLQLLPPLSPLLRT
ncbi:uncharacterized protein LOC144910193 [Branchiostoma floridae x Branchiostoma belcheri]